mmetsp:Transcript_11915/g.25920  ORF Transcript_11915/g.25920 Transcript_11915/m.25920 type:complete len:616 (+) Transcript_11915:103-1950(+)
MGEVKGILKRTAEDAQIGETEIGIDPKMSKNMTQLQRSVSFKQSFSEFQPDKWTVGTYLAGRMFEVGIRDYFVVPGDYNLTLLDEILKHKEMQMISCCNELNAGYAADGYSRAKGVSAVFVTFTVGGLSLINAVAGAYSDNLPMLVVSGGINSNDIGSNRVLHHTTGISKKNQQFEMFQRVTAYAVNITHVNGAKHLIDRAFHIMLREKKPVYLEISCNLALEPLAAPCPFFYRNVTISSEEALELAVRAAQHFWNEAVKPVIVGGPKMRPYHAMNEFEMLADAAGCGVAVMPNAKGMFREDHDAFMGTYWGSVSSPGCCNIVESADLYVFVGPVFNDYTTVGYSTLLKKSKMMVVHPDRVTMPDGSQFGIIKMNDFLARFAKVVTPNSMSLEAFRRVYDAPKQLEEPAPNSPLQVKHLMARLQHVLTSDHALVVETGDSWFNGQRLKLPRGCKYEFQMQYGSIGWAVGAALGMSLALKGEKRTILMTGDGSFQMTAQEMATIIRYNTKPIVLLLNNRGYTIEVEIHDGPYNNIKNWDYVKLIESFSAGESNAKAVRCDTDSQFAAALEEAIGYDGLFFIEATLDRDDCTGELLEWGARVAAANSRKHKDTEEVL